MNAYAYPAQKGSFFNKSVWFAPTAGVWTKRSQLKTSPSVSPSPPPVAGFPTFCGEGFTLRGFTLKGTKGVR